MSPAVAPQDSPHFGTRIRLPRGHSQPVMMQSEDAEPDLLQQDWGSSAEPLCLKDSSLAGLNLS